MAQTNSARVFFEQEDYDGVVRQYHKDFDSEAEFEDWKKEQKKAANVCNNYFKIANLIVF